MSQDPPVVTQGAPGTVDRAAAAPSRGRGRQTAMDMVRSMALVALAVAVVMVLAWRQKPESPPPPDVAGTQATAVATARFSVVSPVGLGSDWQPTSARVELVTGQPDAVWWHLGVVSPGQQYVGLEQSDAQPAAVFVRDQTFQGRPAGEVTVDGATWTRYERSTNGYRSLVRPWGASTVVVNGSADWPEIERFASSLEAIPVPSTTVSGSSSATAGAPAG